MGLPQVEENELSSKVVDILIFSLHSYSSLRRRFFMLLLCFGVLHMNMGCMSPYVMSAFYDNMQHSLDNVVTRKISN